MGEIIGNEDYFRKGAIVEVSLEDEGFRGSWYTATVVRTVSKKTNKILLEFHTLMADTKSGSKPLREYVDFILVRPLPPREPHRVFALNEEVDAFHNDGWWEGIITDVRDDPLPPGSGIIPDTGDNSLPLLPAPSGKGAGRRYSVFFRSSREQIQFQESELRLHREWVYGNWVPPLEDDAPPPPPPPAH